MVNLSGSLTARVQKSLYFDVQDGFGDEFGQWRQRRWRLRSLVLGQPGTCGSGQRVKGEQGRQERRRNSEKKGKHKNKGEQT